MPDVDDFDRLDEVSLRTADDRDYGYCNSCGEEMWEGDECCDDGEWVPAVDGQIGPHA